LTSCPGTDDIITLQRDFGLRFTMLFETQTAAELCGIRRFFFGCRPQFNCTPTTFSQQPAGSGATATCSVGRGDVRDWGAKGEAADGRLESEGSITAAAGSSAAPRNDGIRNRRRAVPCACFCRTRKQVPAHGLCFIMHGLLCSIFQLRVKFFASRAFVFDFAAD
jgi:hypothetical protein